MNCHHCKSYYNSSNVCVFVCSLSPPRSFGGSSPNLVGVCTWTSHLPLRGSFSKRSTGHWVTFTFHYIIYAPASRHTAAKAPFALLLLLQSLIRRLLLHCISTGNCLVQLITPLDGKVLNNGLLTIWKIYSYHFSSCTIVCSSQYILRTGLRHRSRHI